MSSAAKRRTSGRPGIAAARMALICALGSFLVAFLWRFHTFARSHTWLYAFGPFKGRAVLTFVCVCLVLSIYAVWKTRRQAGLRRVAIAALIIVIVQTPYGYKIVHANLTWKYPGWYETTIVGDCRNISTAILLFHKDTGVWPIYTSADHSPESRVDFLYGNMGGMPGFTKEAWESWGNRSDDMFFQLVTNGRQGAIYPYLPKGKQSAHGGHTGPKGWNGPYLPYVTDDPWAYAYLISVSGFEGGTKPDNHVWCLSAGPDNIVDTPAWATEPHGDDIGYRTK